MGGKRKGRGRVLCRGLDGSRRKGRGYPPSLLPSRRQAKEGSPLIWMDSPFPSFCCRLILCRALCLFLSFSTHSILTPTGHSNPSAICSYGGNKCPPHSLYYKIILVDLVSTDKVKNPLWSAMLLLYFGFGRGLVPLPTGWPPNSQNWRPAR